MRRHELPELPYPYDALEPYIDKLTMEIHHTKHHGGYVNNLNLALEKYPHLFDYDLEIILRNLESIPDDIRTQVRNNGGGHLNHSLFWEIMKPGGGGKPKGVLLQEIEKKFGTFENFKNEFSQKAITHFGSGWAWLVLTPFGDLKVISTPNQDNPIMLGFEPVMGIDVWEHAYYLKYQNRRAEYVENWWNVVNWDKIERIYETLIEKLKLMR